MKGQTGKVLRLDLTAGTAEVIDATKYESWVGGFGMGTAIFWDEVDKDYLANAAQTTGFEPENVLCLMAGPLQGTLAPNGGRLEVMGVAPEAYPRPQYTRSNCGGRFASMLKFAGWDGIVVKGKAEKPVWVDVRDDKVEIRDAAGIWGLGTRAAQEDIWRQVQSEYGDWYSQGTSQSAGRTTQRPAVILCGQAGENMTRIASLIHDSGNAAGQGGFGGVFGSKNLKAISVVGTGTVQVADPAELLKARTWLNEYKYDIDALKSNTPQMIMGVGSKPGFSTVLGYGADETFGRPLGCVGCSRNCRANVTQDDYPGGESQCVEALFYTAEDARVNGKKTKVSYAAIQMLQDYGINAYEMFPYCVSWLESLYKRGLLGAGKPINTALDMTKVGTIDWVTKLLDDISFKRDIGADLAEGLPRAAAKWGVLAEDLKNGTFEFIYWIGDRHHGDLLHWAYQSVFTARDINQHDLSHCAGMKQMPSVVDFPIPADAIPNRMKAVGYPWYDDRMGSQGENDAYSIHMARMVAWHRRYCDFWKNSTQLCDWIVFDFFNTKTPDGAGLSPELEPRFFNAVTGADMTYEDGMDLGQKIENFERAIHALQGRHRNEEYFPPFPPYTSYVHTEEPPYLPSWQYPTWNDQTSEYEWKLGNFAIKKDKWDEFKTLFYDLQGWSKDTGRPTRETLNSLGLDFVADVLEKYDTLG